MAPTIIDLFNTGIRGYNGQWTKGHKAITKGLCNFMVACMCQIGSLWNFNQMTLDDFNPLHHSFFFPKQISIYITGLS